MQLLYTPFSVLLGMVQILLPLTIVTLFGAMLRIDRTLYRSQDPRRKRLAGVPHVFLPLSLPGVYGAGCSCSSSGSDSSSRRRCSASPKETMIAQTIMVEATQTSGLGARQRRRGVLLLITTRSPRSTIALQPRPPVGRVGEMSATAGGSCSDRRSSPVLLYLSFR